MKDTRRDPSMPVDKNVLKVRIYGTEYAIRSQADVQYMKSVAEYVDSKMRDVDKNIQDESSFKVAILASLNIADELFKERGEKDALKRHLEEKINQINRLIDQQLPSETKIP
jgi:cell division protein ZapA